MRLFLFSLMVLQAWTMAAFTLKLFHSEFFWGVSPTAVSIDSAKFPLPQLLLFEDEPQTPNIDPYFGNIKQ